tara:strand:+ start:544 stop:1086 length:543 start_codon:yes stop_codon:yes gene_type:complete
MSSARKRLQRSRSSNSVVHHLFRRNTKNSFLWNYVDVNTKTTNLVRPKKNEGGNVLKLKISNQNTGIDVGDFKKGHKIQNFCVGNNSSKIEENSNTSVNGEGLCFSIVFKNNVPAISEISSDITYLANISIHNTGHGYKVGDTFTINGTKFIKNDTSVNSSTYGIRGSNKNMLVEVLEVN